MDLKAQILLFLGTQKGVVRTLHIAKACCGKKATKKQVNPTLYALARQNKVVKVADEGVIHVGNWQIHNNRF